MRTPWTAVVIDPGPFFGVHSQAAAVRGSAARPRILVGESNIAGFDFRVAPHPRLAIHRLLGPAADPAAWEHTPIAAAGTHEARVTDIDGLGRPGVIGHEENPG